MTDEPETGWYSDATSTFGDRITGAREAGGYSQADLARKLGVKLKTIQSWEDDLSEPRANKLQMLAGLLNVSIRWMLTGEGEGLEGPATPGVLTTDARTALAELAQMRAQMQALAGNMGILEKRLRTVLRSGL